MIEADRHVGVQGVRAGVIGLGIGEQHILGYRRAEGCDVVAICDVDAERLREVGERHVIGDRTVSAQELLVRDDIDVVSICGYDDSHARYAITALAHGKHVMVEKPVALDRGEFRELVALQRESGRLLVSNLILRAVPRFVELRDAIRRGDYGDIFYAEGDYIHQILHKITEGWRGRMPGYSVVYGGGIHLIDLLRWLIGDDVVEVCGMGNKLLSQGTQFPGPDTTVNLLRFARGAIAKTTTTFGPQRTQIHRLDVFGSKQTFVNAVGDALRFTGPTAEDVHAVTTPYPGTRKGDLLPQFVRAIETGCEPPIDAEDVFAVMNICFACEEAIRTGRTITVPPL
ncbi:MAG: Gfo/Idh/MocA family protein [Acidimicrobiia bacterium]